MKQKRHTTNQIITKLRQADERLQKIGALLATVGLFLPAYKPVEHQLFIAGVLGLPVRTQIASLWTTQPRESTIILMLAISVVVGRFIFRTDRASQLIAIASLSIVVIATVCALRFAYYAETIDAFGWAWLVLSFSAITLMIGVYAEYEHVFAPSKPEVETLRHIPDNTCLKCGASIPADNDACRECGWTWSTN